MCDVMVATSIVLTIYYDTDVKIQYILIYRTTVSKAMYLIFKLILGNLS